MTYRRCWACRAACTRNTSVLTGTQNDPDDPFLVRPPMRLTDLEARAIDAALRLTEGNRTRAAEVLGIPRSSLYNKLRARTP